MLYAKQIKRNKISELKNAVFSKPRPTLNNLKSHFLLILYMFVRSVVVFYWVTMQTYFLKRFDYISRSLFDSRINEVSSYPVNVKLSACLAIGPIPLQTFIYSVRTDIFKDVCVPIFNSLYFIFVNTNTLGKIFWKKNLFKSTSSINHWQVVGSKQKSTF